MKVVKAFDVSSWSGEIPQGKADEIDDAGYELAIVQLWGGLPDGSSGPNPHAESQLRVFHQAGMYVAGYIWVPPDDEIETNILMDVGLQAAGEELPNLRFVALDIEGQTRLHPTDHVARLLGAVHYLEEKGVQVIIYTSRYMWQTVMNNDLGFSRLPLWDAHYDQSADPVIGFYPYGGWKSCAAKQYTNTTSLLGVNACLDVADLDALHIEDEIEALRKRVAELEDQLAAAGTAYQDLQQKIASIKVAIKQAVGVLDAARNALEYQSR